MNYYNPNQQGQFNPWDPNAMYQAPNPYGVYQPQQITLRSFSKAPAIISMILGIVAAEFAVLSLIPFVAIYGVIFGLPCAIVALCLSSKSRNQTFAACGQVYGMATAGKILSIISLICIGIGLIITLAVCAEYM